MPKIALPTCATVDDSGVSTIATRHQTAASSTNRGSHVATA